MAGHCMWLVPSRPPRLANDDRWVRWAGLLGPHCAAHCAAKETRVDFSRAISLGQRIRMFVPDCTASKRFAARASALTWKSTGPRAWEPWAVRKVILALKHDSWRYAASCRIRFAEWPTPAPWLRSSAGAIYAGSPKSHQRAHCPFPTTAYARKNSRRRLVRSFADAEWEEEPLAARLSRSTPRANPLGKQQG